MHTWGALTCSYTVYRETYCFSSTLYKHGLYCTVNGSIATAIQYSVSEDLYIIPVFSLHWNGASTAATEVHVSAMGSDIWAPHCTLNKEILDRSILHCMLSPGHYFVYNIICRYYTQCVPFSSCTVSSDAWTSYCLLTVINGAVTWFWLIGYICCTVSGRNIVPLNCLNSAFLYFISLPYPQSYYQNTYDELKSLRLT